MNMTVTALTILQLAHVSCLSTIHFILVANVCAKQCFALNILSFAEKPLNRLLVFSLTLYCIKQVGGFLDYSSHIRFFVLCQCYFLLECIVLT